MPVFHLLTVFGCVAAGFVFINAVFGANITDAQPITGAAMAVALVVIPHCLARAMQALYK